MRYQLYYWPMIQGRGEFVRLALEEADARCRDVGRGSEHDGEGTPALLRLLEDEGVAHPPFAPPFLRAGTRLIGQTATILLYLGDVTAWRRPARPGLSTHQLQLTLADV